MRIWLCLAAAAGLAVGAATAEVHFFRINLEGAQEVGGGDPDGSGVAHLAIDDSTDPPTIDWLIEVQNIGDTISGDHIHQAPAGQNGGVKVDFGKKLEGFDLADADLAGVLKDPTGWYVNVHTPDFPSGAIRGQIPEPGTLSLLALAGLAVFRRR